MGSHSRSDFYGFNCYFREFYHFHHVIWRMKCAKKLQTKNGQNMSSGPFGYDAAHLSLLSLNKRFSLMDVKLIKNAGLSVFLQRTRINNDPAKKPRGADFWLLPHMTDIR